MLQEFKLKTFNTLSTNLQVIEEYIENNISQLDILTTIYNQLPDNSNTSHFLFIPSIRKDIETEEMIIAELLYYDNLLKDAITKIDKTQEIFLLPEFKEIHTLSEKLVNKIKIGLEKASAKILLLQSCIDSIFECQEMGNLYSNTYN